ncbi:astacin-like metalloprotease toxin 5 [Haemaphysalis longicornis]
MHFIQAPSFATIFIASSIWLVRQAPTAQALVRWKNLPGNLTVGGDGLFEGDIIIPPQGRIAVGLQLELWPKGIIPYVIDPKLRRHEKLIRRTMDEIESLSCLRFVPRTSEHKAYVKIVDRNGCSSQVGRTGRGPQLLKLGPGCRNRIAVLHELMHAAGFIHEHSRADRDQYVKVFPENAKPEHAHEFRKLPHRANEPLSPFDFGSVMLYDSKAFARKNLYTILTKDGGVIPSIWKRPGLSQYDVQGIREAYGCR